MEENINDENDDTGDELAEAVMNFMNLFSSYVKECDPRLWKRAIDYAKSFAETENVKFLYYDDEPENDEDKST